MLVNAFFCNGFSDNRMTAITQKVTVDNQGTKNEIHLPCNIEEFKKNSQTR